MARSPLCNDIARAHSMYHCTCRLALNEAFRGSPSMESEESFRPGGSLQYIPSEYSLSTQNSPYVSLLRLLSPLQCVQSLYVMWHDSNAFNHFCVRPIFSVATEVTCAEGSSFRVSYQLVCLPLMHLLYIFVCLVQVRAPPVGQTGP